MQNLQQKLMRKLRRAFKGLMDFRFGRLICCALILVTTAAASLAQAPNINELQRRFLQPPDDARIMMRWWWVGPAVTKPELEREMRVMKDGGIGGFEVHPVYPLTVDDPDEGARNLPFRFH